MASFIASGAATDQLKVYTLSTKRKEFDTINFISVLYEMHGRTDCPGIIIILLIYMAIFCNTLRANKGPK